MPSTAVVIGKVGPAVTLPTVTFNLVTWFSIDTNNELLDIMYNNGDGARRIQVDISAAATITCTVSGANYTLTVAN